MSQINLTKILRAGGAPDPALLARFNGSITKAGVTLARARELNDRLTYLLPAKRLHVGATWTTCINRQQRGVQRLGVTLVVRSSGIFLRRVGVMGPREADALYLPPLAYEAAVLRFTEQHGLLRL